MCRVRKRSCGGGRLVSWSGFKRGKGERVQDADDGLFGDVGLWGWDFSRCDGGGGGGDVGLSLHGLTTKLTEI